MSKVRYKNISLWKRHRRWRVNSRFQSEKYTRMEGICCPS